MSKSFANMTFVGANPTWANACVGDNGAPGMVDYAEGFATAANALLDTAIADQGTKLTVDTLVYPVCFTMRHAIELFLKNVTVNLAQIGEARGVSLPAFDLVASHDLGRIWAYVKTHAPATDERLAGLVSKLDEYVTDVADMDATGQVFRYPFDLESKKHLTSIGIINFVVLKRRFNEIQPLLEELNRATVGLVEEYSWGTCTKNLSRLQIRRIAAELPPMDRWGEAFFDQVRADLKAKYKLGSKELSTAIDLIKKRHEMAACIGATVPIPGLEVAALERFFDTWCSANDLNLVINPPPPRILCAADISDALQDMLDRDELSNALSAEMDPDQYAVIEALFYFADNPPVSEAFEKMLAIHQREAAQYKASPTVFKQSLRDMMGNSRVFKRILYSLDFLGQADALEAVIARYGLEPARERLLELSKRRKAIPE